ESRVAQPHVAVVPVAVAADPLGKARRRRRDDRTGRRERHELERQSRALDGLAPAPVVLRLRDPGLPEPQSVEELVAAERGELRRIRPGPVAAPRDDDGDLVSLREEELRRQAPLVGGALQGREDVERNGGRRKTVAPGGALRLHARQAVIERWAALHA